MMMRSKHPFIVALDCGSTNFKAAVFDRSLRRLGECSEPLRYIVRGPQRVEFDPDVAWRISVRLIRKVCAQAGLSTAAVGRVVLTSQANTFCALDKAGQPLIPFMSWQDQRSSREAALLNRRLGAGFHAHCSWPRAAAGLQVAMLLWLKLHRPQCLEKAAAIVTLPGFLAMRLGMPNSVDPNLAAMNGLYSLKTGRWWKPVLKICGVSELQLPMLVPSGRPLGKTVTCRDLVLAQKAMVILAGNDQTAGAFGNFCSRKHMLVTLGTALVVYRVMGRRQGPYTAEGCWGPYPNGGYYELATRNHGCIALDWARARLAPGRDIKFFMKLARKALVRRKAMADCQAEALFYPDAMNTKRAWVGSLEPGERALAVFEGIGFALKQMIEDELRVPSPLPEVRVVGGGSVNVFWLQLLADILNTRVVHGAGDALLGAARQACPRAMPRRVAEGIIFQPKDVEAYKMRYVRWQQQYPRAQKRSPRTDAQWTLDFEIKGRARQTALRQAGMVFKHWGLVMPGTDPLTPHFGLHDFFRIGGIEYWIVNDRQNGYCGKFLFLFKNQRCPRHHHRAKDETFFIVRGLVRMTAGRRQFMMKPGDIFKMRPGTDHTFVAVGGPALILEVSLPSIQHDNFFTDKAIGNQGVI